MAQPTPQTRHFIARRLRAVVRPAIGIVVMLLVVLAGGALFLASSSGKAFVSYRYPGRFAINSGSRHAPAVSITGPARSASRCTPSPSGSPPRRARSSTWSAWRSILPRHFPRKPRPPPARCHQARSRARLHDASCVGGRRTILHNRSHVRHPGWATARSRDHVGQSDGTRVAVRGLSLSLTGGGPGSYGEQLSCRVGGPSGAARRRSASIGHARTWPWPERRWTSRRSRWSRRWLRSAGPRASTSAAAISP